MASSSPAVVDLDRRFIQQAMSRPMLAADHEQALARRWREEADEEALHELIEAYMRLVISMARRFKAYGLPFADLVSEGNVGLMIAAARFEPERGLRFSTYAAWWVRSQIQDYVLRNWSIVRTGTTATQKRLFFSLRRLRAALDDLSEGRLSAEARTLIAADLGVREDEIERMAERLAAPDRSLNAPLGETGADWQDLLPDDAELPEARAIAVLDGQVEGRLLDEALATLNARERRIIEARRLADEPATLETLGAQLGVSKERVRQIELRALEKLRTALGRTLSPR